MSDKELERFNWTTKPPSSSSSEVTLEGVDIGSLGRCDAWSVVTTSVAGSSVPVLFPAESALPSERGAGLETAHQKKAVITALVHLRAGSSSKRTSNEAVPLKGEQFAVPPRFRVVEASGRGMTYSQSKLQPDTISGSWNHRPYETTHYVVESGTTSSSNPASICAHGNCSPEWVLSHSRALAQTASTNSNRRPSSPDGAEAAAEAAPPALLEYAEENDADPDSNAATSATGFGHGSPLSRKSRMTLWPASQWHSASSIWRRDIPDAR